ncbi:hypothetical protein [Microlunatus parietis]|uniref:Polyketide cyclase / dehydrase and lipid transport n=1 Tax=Microlunatus parietis TaxID=682979 RepID=A0A7Y9LEI7_9ACTN|nr:hypothetical protein [Microlunatus parietis]NYE73888.1 hypothetical protein [Microlunatus parietis]
MRRSAAPWLVLGVAALTAAVWVAARAYREVRNWGAEPADLARDLPGDDLLPDAEFARTRAVNIDASSELVWRWLMRSGRPYGWLRGRWLGQFDGYALTLALIEPPRLLVLRQGGPGQPWDLTWAFMIIDGQRGWRRLVIRTRARAHPGLLGRIGLAGFRLLDPLTVATTRRMLLDVKYHAEASRLDPLSS